MPPRTRSRTGRARPVEVPHAKVGLSTASVYPENCATAFELATRLGYDGVEVMVWTDPVTREAGALARAGRAPRHPRAVGARPDPARDPAGVGDRPVGQGRPLRRARARARGRHRRAAPAVPVAARVRAGLRRRGGAARARLRHPARGREHVPVARAPQPRARGVPARTGTRCRSRTTT